MALILKRISDGYNYLVVELADPRVKSYPLMNSPFPVMAIVGFYLFFVFKLGPKLMKNRPPFNLERILVVYNIFQIIACIYLIIVQITTSLFSYSLMCEPVDYSYSDKGILIARHVWLYHLLKLIDLLDTVFFVLRKKNNQITFLHVYHHAGMCFLSWYGTKYFAGGHSIFVGFLNNIVHVVMYSYYLLSAWDKEYKKNVWWKKHITQLQLLQFLMIAVYYAQLIFQPNCGYPAWTAWYFVPQNIFMMVLFTNFYIKTYVKPQAKPKIKNHSSATTNGVENGKKKLH